MDGEAWKATVHGVAKSQTLTKQLHFHFSLSCIGEGNGNPLQYSCLENPRDGRAWWAAFYGVAQSRTRLKRLSSSSSSSRRHLEIKVYAHSRAHKGSKVGFRNRSGLFALYTSHFYNQEAINLTFNLHK